MSKERLPTMELAKEAGLPVYRFPVSQEEVEKAEDALAKDLSKLSLDHQEQILFDFHGIATSTKEEEENKSIAEALRELEKEIDKISKKDAYEQALFMNPTYVVDDKFRLLFLRADEFKPKAAAEAIVTHFEVKRELFGDGEVLAREVRQSDMSPEDMEQLRRGVVQILPERDACGRTVMIINSNASADSIQSLEQRKIHESRSHFYTSMAALRDEQVQTEGLVWAFYAMNDPMIGDFASFEWVSRVDAAVPIVSVAGHLCYDSYILRPLIAGFRLFTNKRERHRMRPHFGNLEEVHFKLQTFGIPMDASPMQPDGTWSTEYHRLWLHAQRFLEESSENEQHSNGTNDIVIIPRRFDVLFGKGSRARLSTGTQRALHLVDMHIERYERANKFEKTDLAEKIISLVHESNGRFLRQDENNNGCWVQVDDVDARKKIAHWFRHARSKNKSKQQLQKEIEVDTTRSSGRRSWEALVSDVTASTSRPFKRASPSPSASLTEISDDSESSS